MCAQHGGRSRTVLRSFVRLHSDCLDPLFARSAMRVVGVCRSGFTLVEVMIVVAIIGTLATLGSPVYTKFIDKSRNTRAISEIRSLEKNIMAYKLEHESLPNSLAEVEGSTPLDPWGRSYQYLRIDGGTAKIGDLRKDRFLAPLNSDYDLYTMGKDGVTKPPLNNRDSWDDILRANDGAYLGLASEY